MHSLFYFLAAAFLNIFFAKKIIFRHVVIFIFLILFGIAIEFAQEYSNKFLHKRIHGRFDTEDIQSNFKGLIVFSILWITYNVILFVNKRRNTRIQIVVSQTGSFNIYYFVRREHKRRHSNIKFLNACVIKLYFGLNFTALAQKFCEGFVARLSVRQLKTQIMLSTDTFTHFAMLHI